MKAEEPTFEDIMMYLDEVIDKYSEALQKAGVYIEIVKLKSCSIIVVTPTEPHNPCNNDNPDDMCKNCTCWKATRKNCS